MSIGTIILIILIIALLGGFSGIGGGPFYGTGYYGGGGLGLIIVILLILLLLGRLVSRQFLSFRDARAGRRPGQSRFLRFAQLSDIRVSRCAQPGMTRVYFLPSFFIAALIDDAASS